MHQSPTLIAECNTKTKEQKFSLSFFEAVEKFFMEFCFFYSDSPVRVELRHLVPRLGDAC